MCLPPEDVQTWFPPVLQQRYVEHILIMAKSQVGSSMKLTPVQAGHLVRLWGYAYIKHFGFECAPIEKLICRLNSFSCSHNEAARLFYADRDEGGMARSAGNMLRTLESMNLIRCESTKGSPTRISLNLSVGFQLPEEYQGDEVLSGAFNPRRDARILANLLTVLFQYDTDRSTTIGDDITRVLREWSRRYPDGIRVLKQAGSQKPIAIVTVFPIHSDSSSRFSLPPGNSLYLNRLHHRDEDTFQFAEPGNQECEIAYIRCWHIKPGFWNHKIVLLLMHETRTLLEQMRQDYPGLCDVFSLVLHPHHEDLAIRLGFEILQSDPSMSQRWAYIALDDFLELDVLTLLQDFDFEPYNRSSFMQ